MKDMETRHIGTRGNRNLLSGAFKQASGTLESRMGGIVGSNAMQARGQARLEEASTRLRRARVQRLVDESRDS